MIKTFLALYFIFIYSIGFTQINKIIIDDQAGLLNEIVESNIKSLLLQDKIRYDVSLDYEKRCEYLYITFTEQNNDILLSSRDCNRNALENRIINSDIKLATDETVAKYLASQIKELAQQLAGGETTDDSKMSSNAEFKNHHESRYFFAPSAYNLKKGQLYYQTLYFLVHDLQYGITDNFSIGMGTTVAFIPAYITPKFSTKLTDNINFMVGDLFVFGTYATNFNLNIVYSGFTFGNQNNNVTISGGMLTGSFMTTPKPLFNISAMMSASNYIYLVTENYFTSYNVQGNANKRVLTNVDQFGYEQYDYLNEEFTAGSNLFAGFTGFRFVSKKRDVSSFQAGFAYFVPLNLNVPIKYNNWDYVNINGPENSIILPTVSYTLKFGKLY